MRRAAASLACVALLVPGAAGACEADLAELSAMWLAGGCDDDYFGTVRLTRHEKLCAAKQDTGEPLTAHRCSELFVAADRSCGTHQLRLLELAKPTGGCSGTSTAAVGCSGVAAEVAAACELVEGASACPAGCDTTFASCDSAGAASDSGSGSGSWGWLDECPEGCFDQPQQQLAALSVLGATGLGAEEAREQLTAQRQLCSGLLSKAAGAAALGVGTDYEIPGRAWFAIFMVRTSASQRASSLFLSEPAPSPVQNQRCCFT